MAPNLAPSTPEFIRDMILSKELKPSQIANAADCQGNGEVPLYLC